MNTWQFWSPIVSVATLVVAFVGAWFAIREDRWQRRLTPTVNFSLEVLGVQYTPGGAMDCHVWTLCNAGTVGVHVQAVAPIGCSFRFDDEHRPVIHLGPGEPKDLLVEPCDESNAWVIICWYPPFAPHKCMNFQWLAPAPGPELAAELVRQAGDPPGWWERLRRRLTPRRHTVQAVGPGGARNTSIRIGHKKTDQQLEHALSLVTASTDQPR